MLEKFWSAVNLQALATHLMTYLPKLVSAVLLLILFWVMTRILQNVLRKALCKTSVTAHAQNLLLRIAKYAMVIIAALTVADQLGINIASLIAGVGIAGLAISFAAQDTIANFISGVAIIIDRPFKEGDWISLNGTHATVSEIRLRTTVLTTFDNETIVTPNKQLAQERVINYTLTPRIRVRVPIGIAYKEEIETARQVMLQTTANDKRILPDPAPVVILASLGDSSVNLEMRFWTQDPLQKFPLASEYTEKCKNALDAAGIEIPFPHMQLFLEPTPAVDRLAAAKIAAQN